MSKLKLLLLGGIFTLLGIFNFSSANTTYTISCSIYDVIDNGCIINLPNEYTDIVSYSITNCVNNTSYPSFSFKLNNENAGGGFSPGGCERNGGPYTIGNFNSIYIDYEQGLYTPEDYDINSTITYVVGGGNEGGNTGGGEGGDIEGGTILNGFGELTPAIDSLKGTVYQIIPYVVYIGIGTLLAVLGFYAVRWLVNRIVKKINFVFRSKRG